MDLMKKGNALILGLAVLLAFGCGSDNDTVAPDNANPAPQNFTKCQLIKDREDTLTSKYSYDSQGRLQERVYAYGRERFTYNSLGKILKWIRFTESLDTINVRTYEYNNDSLPIKVTSRSGMTSAGGIIAYHTQSMVYDSQKRIISNTTYNTSLAAITNKVNYSYPANNKVEIEGWELNRGTNTLQLHYNAQMTYDNNKTPWGDYPFFDPIVNHNELTYAIQFHQPYPYSHSRTSTYTFNAAGYPIQKIEVTDGRYTMVSTYTYNCQ
ncbi:hypothetical protein [Adhaeribacter soli]|uniref:DUF4595 domain-containing protein n=1 Tax=Adhaeribacter soli TaxID=2607655 RepID=A0A5N1J138_9BACT|nr:hypothetical protein [Adhaeribacter soli]KAA9340211.1 hypothetical protein F0P94_07640 [Adhaeribacter soli]